MDKECFYHIMKCRIGGNEEDKPIKPRIAVKVDGKIYDYDLFLSENNLYEDLKFLASIWFNLIPEEGMNIGQKQHEIAQYLAGKRGAGEFSKIINDLILNGD